MYTAAVHVWLLERREGEKTQLLLESILWKIRNKTVLNIHIDISDNSNICGVGHMDKIMIALMLYTLSQIQNPILDIETDE